MIEIRAYQGSPAELTAFIRRIWTTAFHGRILFPLWSQQELEWQFFDNPHGQPDYMLAAYDGARLIGTLLAIPAEYKANVGDFQGSCAGWFTVDPAYGNSLVGHQLIDAMRARHADRKARALLGFAFPTGQGMGLEFWQAFAQTFPTMVERPVKVRVLVRVLDARRLASSSLTLGDHLTARLLGAVTPSTAGYRGSVNVRDFRPEDLPRCLTLLEQVTKRADLRYKWSPDGLAHHLQYKRVPKTLVLESNGVVEGWITFYYVEMFGRREFMTALVDEVVCGNLSGQDRQMLIYAALQRMAGDGAIAAIVLRLPVWPIASLIRAAFVPYDLGYYLFCIGADPTVRLPVTPNFYLHLR